MKKLVITSIASLLIVAGCSSSQPEMKEEVTKVETKVATAVSGGVVNFEYQDIEGDDNGAGNYTYPTSNVMVEGAYDLKKFSITEDGEDYVFTFVVPAQIKNDFGTDDDWDIQLFDVYINLGEGKYNHTIAGRHVKIAGGWDRGLSVTPKGPMTSKYELKKSITNSVDDETPAENFIADVMIPDSKEIQGNIIIARISKAKMGDISGMKGIQVFSSGFEGMASPENALIRDVNEFESKWRFGGGTDYAGDPNVIDILGDNAKLGEYQSEEGVTVYSTVDLIPIK